MNHIIITINTYLDYSFYESIINNKSSGNNHQILLANLLINISNDVYIIY